MIRTEDELRSFVDAVLAFSDELYTNLGLALEILNFGGSLSTPTVRGLNARDVRLNRTFQRELTPADPAASLSIEQYTTTLVGLVEQFYAERRRERPRIFIEPGRAMTGDAQMLLSSVISTKVEGDTTYAILNAGINLAESCRSEYHALLPVNRATEPSDTHPHCRRADLHTRRHLVLGREAPTSDDG